MRKNRVIPAKGAAVKPEHDAWQAEWRPRRDDGFQWSDEAIDHVDQFIQSYDRFERADYGDRTSRIIARACKWLGIEFSHLVLVRWRVSSFWKGVKAAFARVFGL